MKRLSGCVAVLVSLLVVVPRAEAQIIIGWRLNEFQPDIPNGGRVDTIAVDPTKDTRILVASESGGLFRSSDGGATWHHVDSLKVFNTNAVAYVPSNPKIIIVTASEDFRTSNGGGIWRSIDGGTNWKHIANPSAPAGVTDRYNAWEISIAPDTGKIYVGTSYGVAMSENNGSTWKYVDVFAAGNRSVISVVAQSGDLVIAGGFAGIRRSTDAGGMWTAPATGVGGIWDIHAFGRNPAADTVAYVMNGSTNLYFSEDSGDHWTQITSAAAGGGTCGGIAFVKAIKRLRKRPHPLPPQTVVDLYAGNRCGLQKMTAPRVSTGHFDYSGSWTTLNMDHGDTRELSFTSLHQPLLLGTDGGLHKTSDGGANWSFVGGGSAGYNALQITEVKGQWIEDIGRHDLYFGTQDNSNWASGDDGATWINPFCCEGFFFERQYRVDTEADSQITHVSCGPCGDFFSGALLTGVGFWGDAQSPPDANPKIIRKDFHVQGVRDAAPFAKGYAQTTNTGGAWTQYATFPEDRRDQPKLTSAIFRPLLYQSIRTGYFAAGDFEINTLARIRKRLFGTGATVSYPAMNNFGGLGINPTMFAWYQVFGVDPGDWRHVIAPDVVNEKMMETWDGGNNWTEIPALTNLVTDGGNFLFRRWIFPHASAVSFSEDDPNLVAVGTWQNGLMVSADRGATWVKVPNSERATDITSIEWKASNEAILSTYGRGLWDLRWVLILPRPDFEARCKIPCTIFPDPKFLIDPADIYERAILVYNGRIQGARIVDGVVTELFVSPGSSPVFFSESKSDPAIKITTAKSRVGLLGAKGRLISEVFAEKPLTHEQKKEDDRDDPENEKSPIAGKPYVQLLETSGGGSNSVTPGSTLTVSGRNFPRDTQLEIVIDRQVVEKAYAREGEWKVTVRAPNNEGLHTLTVRDANGKVIDGTMFLVRHVDLRKER
ncbi:MAG TPA: hypothetical protein VJZ00_18370 [Thermoanaerobaculia bacterium]|nr:hypothetical protein [Thermoanaerobaculia bacterium]